MNILSLRIEGMMDEDTLSRKLLLQIIYENFETGPN
jgi:hypothetical protein